MNTHFKKEKDNFLPGVIRDDGSVALGPIQNQCPQIAYAIPFIKMHFYIQEAQENLDRRENNQVLESTIKH